MDNTAIFPEKAILEVRKKVRGGRIIIIFGRYRTPTNDPTASERCIRVAYYYNRLHYCNFVKMLNTILF